LHGVLKAIMVSLNEETIAACRSIPWCVLRWRNSPPPRTDFQHDCQADPEGFRELDVSDDFVGLIGPLWFKAEASACGSACPRGRHGNRWAGRMAGCWSPWPTW